MNLNEKTPNEKPNQPKKRTSPQKEKQLQQQTHSPSQKKTKSKNTLSYTKINVKKQKNNPTFGLIYLQKKLHTV